MIKGKNTKLRFNDKTYEIGQPFSGLSDKEEASLVASGIAEYEYTAAQKTNQANQDEKLVPEGNVASVAKYVATIEDVELLKKMLEEEMADKKRKGVFEAISNRCAELSPEADTEDDEDKDTEDPNKLVGTFNPSDAIVTGAQE